MNKENLTVWEKYLQGTNYINQYNNFTLIKSNGKVEALIIQNNVKNFLSKMLGLYDTDTNCGVINIGPEDLEYFVKKSNCNNFKYIFDSTNTFDNIIKKITEINAKNMLIAIKIKIKNTNIDFEKILVLPRFNNQDLNNLITIGIDENIENKYKYLILYR